MIKEERRETHRRTQTDMDKDWTRDTEDLGCGNADPQKWIRISADGQRSDWIDVGILG
jgi:hypothetical protein